MQKYARLRCFYQRL